MANAQCFLSREELTLDALDALVAQIQLAHIAPGGVGILIASEHHRPQAEKLRGTLVRIGKLDALVGTVSGATLVNNEGFFGKPVLALLRWEPSPETRPTPLQLSRLGDDNLDAHIDSAVIISSSATAGAVLASCLRHEIFAIGAISFAAEPTLQFHRDGSIIAGATGLGWRDSNAIATTLIPSAETLGESYEITAAHEDVVIELNGRPATDVLCEMIGLPPKSAFEAIGIDYLIGIERNAYDYNQQIHRHITALDPDQRMFSVGYPVEQGDRLTVGARNARSAARLLKDRCIALRERVSGRRVDALVFHGCIARGPALFTGPSEEASIIADVFPGIPLLGIYGNGEFFGHDLQSYAAVVTAILD